MMGQRAKTGEKALVPISMSSQRFSSKRLRIALPEILSTNTDIVFLVADRLQMYNDAANKWPDKDIGEVVNWSEFPRSYFPQRKRWLERVYSVQKRERCNKVRILSMDEACDAQCFGILRNLNILFDVNDQFRKDVQDEVYRHLQRRRSYVDLARAVRLSTHYLLEEVAVNLRLRVLENIEREYYLGEQLRLLPRIYAGAYSVSVFDLAGVARNSDCRFLFYSWTEGSQEGRWIENSTAY